MNKLNQVYETPSMDEQIDDIISTFNFEKVLIVMKAVGWKYHDHGADNLKDPTIADLVGTATRVLEIRAGQYAKNPDNSSVATGGFRVDNFGPWLRLQFIMEESRIHCD